MMYNANATKSSKSPCSSLPTSPKESPSLPVSPVNTCFQACGINSRDDLRQRLTPLQYQVTQEKGTERQFSGKYYKTKDDGIYACIICGEELFCSRTKYDSGSGWPAFFDILDRDKVRLKPDLSHVGGNILLLAMNPNLIRKELSCSKCNSHLGHLFDDGPKPSGKRFCVNSAALNFKPRCISDNGDQTENKDLPKCDIRS